MKPEELAWKQYKRLELEFLDICEHVELAKEHLNVYSFKLMNLIVRIGVEFDCASNALLAMWQKNPPIWDKKLAETLKKTSRNSSFFNMGHYRNAFELRFTASKHYVTVDTLGIKLYPFKPAPKSKRALKWWAAFTSLKHDRTSNFVKSATMRHALYGLAALLIVVRYLASTANNYGFVFSDKEWSSLFSVNAITYNAPKSFYRNP